MKENVLLHPPFHCLGLPYLFSSCQLMAYLIARTPLEPWRLCFSLFRVSSHLKKATLIERQWSKTAGTQGRQWCLALLCGSVALAGPLQWKKPLRNSLILRHLLWMLSIRGKVMLLHMWKMCVWVKVRGTGLVWVAEKLCVCVSRRISGESHSHKATGSTFPHF